MVKGKGTSPPWLGRIKRRYKISGIVFLLLLIFVGAATYYIETRKNKIAAAVLDILDENYSGDIDYDRISLDHWSTLSDPSIYFDNLTVSDTSSANHLRLRAKKVNLELSIKDLLGGMIQIKSVRLTGGELLLDNYTPLTPEEMEGIPPVVDSLKLSDNWIDPFLEKNTRLNVSDFHIQIRHHVKNKRFVFQVHELASDIEFTQEAIATRTTLDVDIEGLGFNLENGSFVDGARARGTLESVFDRSRKQLDINSFPLELGDQVFDTSAKLNFMGLGTFDIALENDKTEFSSTMALLTENIREKFSAIALEGPLSTRTRLEGSFYYKNNPRIAVRFQSEDNTAVFESGKKLTEMKFSGEFTNRLYADERDEPESPKNFRIQLPELQGRFRDFALQVRDMELTSSPDAENALIARVSASGSPESLNNLVTDQHWSFQGGQLEFISEIDVNGLNMIEILSTARSTFTLQDTRVINNDNGVSLPVSAISLAIEDNRATLERLSIEVKPGQDLLVQAGFSNFSNLFGDNSKAAAHSEFRITSENLIWEDYIQLFETTSSGRKTKRPQVVLRDLLRDIQDKYNPEIEISLGQFHFGQSVLTDLRSGLHFENPDLLRLDETSFGMEGGEMKLQGYLDLAYEDSVPIEATVEGRANINVLNQLLTNDQFTLSGGQFRFSAALSGDLLLPEEILGQSESLIQMSDINAIYIPAGITFPVKSMELELKKDHARLNDLTLYLGKADAVTFSGDIKNLSALLFGGIQKPVESELHVQSEKLIWDDFIQMFGKVDSAKTIKTHKDAEAVVDAERRLKARLRDIYSALNPRLTVEVKEFRYGDRGGFHELETGISFKDAQTLQLEQTRFLYDRKTAVNLQGEIDIADSRKTHVRMEIIASGDPEELNDVLNNDTFVFRGGAFRVKARIRGDVEALDSLISHSDSQLNIEDTFVVHRPSGVHFPINSLNVGLDNNKATLNALELELESGDRIILKGEVDYISDLIFDLPPEKTRTYSTLSLQAAKLDFDEFRSLFAMGQENSVKAKHKTAIRQTIRDVYNKFRPGLKVSIDAFSLDKLVVHNLKSGLHFEDQNRIYLEKSEFEFHQGSVSLDAHLDISKPESTLFSFGVTTDRIEVDKLLEAFDYFDLPSLRSASEINGLVSLDTEIEGEINKEGLINPESLRGIINFDMEEAQVAGFEPIIKSGGKIFKKERLQDIRFMPIQNSMILENKILDIPLMEIQSSAFELFVAGQLGFGDALTNLWIGFPLNNLKSRDVRNIPDKKGYMAAGKKVYVEAKSDEKKGMKYVLHLTPKKFFEERDMMESYRTDPGEQKIQIRRYKRTDDTLLLKDSKGAFDNKGNTHPIGGGKEFR